MREAEMRLFNRTPLNAPTTPFERKLVAARDNKSTITSHTTVQKRTTGYNDEESLDNIRAWQRHYKKAFPSFVFYYESVTDETRMKISRMVLSLGAVRSFYYYIYYDNERGYTNGSIIERRKVLFKISNTCCYIKIHTNTNE